MVLLWCAVLGKLGHGKTCLYSSSAHVVVELDSIFASGNLPQVNTEKVDLRKWI